MSRGRCQGRKQESGHARSKRDPEPSDTEPLARAANRLSLSSSQDEDPTEEVDSIGLRLSGSEAVFGSLFTACVAHVNASIPSQLDLDPVSKSRCTYLRFPFGRTGALEFKLDTFNVTSRFLEVSWKPFED